MKDDTLPIPSYKKPPIIETVWSVQFSEIDWLLPPHTGLFWNLIRGQFPICEERPPIAHVTETDNIFSPPVQHAEMLSVPPLSRQWFVSGSKNELIQLQRDRLCCNWRRVKPSDIYPRYGRMRELFESGWKTLCSFVAGEEHPPLSVDQCEMTYINHIDQGQCWDGIEQVAQVFPVMRWAQKMSFLSSPQTLGAKLVFESPDLGGRLHVSLRHGVRTDESSDNKQLLILELTARGLPEETDLKGLLAWYGLARETIVRGFTDLTTPAMHELWEREQ